MCSWQYFRIFLSGPSTLYMRVCVCSYICIKVLSYYIMLYFVHQNMRHEIISFFLMKTGFETVSQTEANNHKSPTSSNFKAIQVFLL